MQLMLNLRSFSQKSTERLYRLSASCCTFVRQSRGWLCDAVSVVWCEMLLVLHLPLGECFPAVNDCGCYDRDILSLHDKGQGMDLS